MALNWETDFSANQTTDTH